MTASAYYQRGYGWFRLFSGENELREYGLDGTLIGSILTYSRTSGPLTLNTGVHLNRFEHQMDGGRAEELTHEHQQRQFEPASRVQLIERKSEKVFPKREMRRFDRDQFIQGGVHFGGGHLTQGFVEGEVEQFIEHEGPGETGIREGGMIGERP